MPINEEDDTWWQEFVNLLTPTATISCLISASNWSCLSIAWDPCTAPEKYAGHICDYLLHMEILWHGTLTFPRLFSHCPSPPLVHTELEIPCVPDNHALSSLMLRHTSLHLPRPTLTALPQGNTNIPSNSLQQPSMKLLWVTSERSRLHSHGMHTPLVLGNTLLCPPTDAPHYCF